MIRLTRDLHVAEEKILSADVRGRTVAVRFDDGSPSGRTVEVPDFADDDAARRWVGDGFPDRSEADFAEREAAPASVPQADIDVPATVGHPTTPAEVKDANEDVDDETAEKIAAAAGVPAGMVPVLTPELAEIRERELAAEAEAMKDPEAEPVGEPTEDDFVAPAIDEPAEPTVEPAVVTEPEPTPGPVVTDPAPADPFVDPIGETTGEPADADVVVPDEDPVIDEVFIDIPAEDSDERSDVTPA